MEVNLGTRETIRFEIHYFDESTSFLRHLFIVCLEENWSVWKAWHYFASRLFNISTNQLFSFHFLSLNFKYSKEPKRILFNLYLVKLLCFTAIRKRIFKTVGPFLCACVFNYEFCLAKCHLYFSQFPFFSWFHQKWAKVIRLANSLLSFFPISPM